MNTQLSKKLALQLAELSRVFCSPFSYYIFRYQLRSLSCLSSRQLPLLSELCWSGQPDHRYIKKWQGSAALPGSRIEASSESYAARCDLFRDGVGHPANYDMQDLSNLALCDPRPCGREYDDAMRSLLCR